MRSQRENSETPHGAARQGVLAFGRRRRGRPRYVDTALESDIQNACMRWLALHNIMAWRINSGAATAEHNGRRRFIKFNSAPGMADLNAVVCGVFVAIEIKRPGKDATPEQAAFLDCTNRAGGLGIVVHSVEELAAALKAITPKNPHGACVRHRIDDVKADCADACAGGDSKIHAGLYAEVTGDDDEIPF
jgi:hypothetical protein